MGPAYKRAFIQRLYSLKQKKLMPGLVFGYNYRSKRTWLFSWVQIFVESWRWLSELIFVVLNFVATSECTRMRSQIIAMNSDRVYIRVDVGPWSRVLATTSIRTYGPPESGKNCMSTRTHV